MSRIALIGDVGGHLDQLTEALISLGADPDTGTLPADLTVVQVGDLVHRGPDSDSVVQLVDRFLTRDPNTWVQLMGNHEACHLGQDLFPHETLDADTEATLRLWQGQGLLRLAVELDTTTGPVLVTHAGLTDGLWDELGQPTTPAQAVKALDARPDLARRPGRMLTGSAGTGGVLWAEAGHELYESWLRAEHSGLTAPFGQVHGHSSAYRWGIRRPTVPADVTDRLALDEPRRHVHVTLAGRKFTGIDPGFGRQAHGRWAPLTTWGRVA